MALVPCTARASRQRHAEHPQRNQGQGRSAGQKRRSDACLSVSIELQGEWCAQTAYSIQEFVIVTWQHRGSGDGTWLPCSRSLSSTSEPTHQRRISF